MILGLDQQIFSPRLDLVFKSMFTQHTPESRGALIDFLSSVTRREIAEVTIQENELAVGGIDEKQSTMDINCKFDDGEQANIEIQVKDYGNMGVRAEYHVCKLHSGQPIKGLDYDALHDTYQITLTDYNLFEDEIYFDEFQYQSEQGRKLKNGKTHIVVIELSKLQKLLQKPAEDLSAIDMWAIFLKYVDDKSKRPLINTLIEKEEGLAMASEQLKKIAQDDAMRIAIYAREKAETDRLAEIARATRIGRQEGLQEGLQEGVQKGKREIIRAFVKSGMAFDTIANISGISTDEIKKIINEQ